MAMAAVLATTTVGEANGMLHPDQINKIADENWVEVILEEGDAAAGTGTERSSSFVVPAGGWCVSRRLRRSADAVGRVGQPSPPPID